jgi:transmembrane sensor
VIDDTLLEQAAEWLVRLDEDDCSEAERQTFAQWCASDPRHTRAVEQMRQVIGQFAGLQPQHHAAATALGSAFVRPRRRLPRNAAGLGVAILAVALLSASNREWRDNWLADLHTAPGEWRRERLADDTLLSLAGNSAVRLHYDNGQRRIELLHGEIRVDVAPDPQRPFLVTTPDGSMRALGTRFIVTREDHATLLGMLHSQVLARSADGAKQLQVGAGEQVRISEHDLQRTTQLDPQTRDQAWQRRQLVVHDEPLGAVLEQLAQQQRGYWHYDAKALAHLRISAVLPLDDSARALALIEEILPVRVQRLTPWLVRVSEKKE